MVKVHRVELLVIDHDNLGSEGIATAIEHTRYPNRCITPEVMKVDTVEVEWSDDHPLNHSDKSSAEYEKLFLKR